MKQTKKLLGIIAMFAVIVFMALPLTGCPDGGDDGTPAPSPKSEPPTPPSDPQEIRSVSITVTPPSEGVSPVPTATKNGITTNYEVGSVTWYPNDDPFIVNTEYTVTVTLTAGEGYKFAASGLTAKINNNNATTTVVSTDGATLTLTYTFITLPPVSNVSIPPASQPTKLTYNQDDPLDLAGLMITVYFESGEPRNIPFAKFGEFNVTTSPAQGDRLSVSEHNGQKITVIIGGEPAQTGELTVYQRTPTADDFIVNDATFTYDGIAKSISVTTNPEKIFGTIGTFTPKYNSNATAINANESGYPVSIELVGNDNYGGGTIITSKKLIINKATPALGDYDINVTPQFVTNLSDIVEPVTVKLGVRPDGALTFHYEGTSGTTYIKSTTKPNKPGTFIVTFDVAGTNNWNATTTSFSAGTLEINVFKGTDGVTDLGTWLKGLTTANDAATAIPIALNVGTLNSALKTQINAGTKYVSLDLSGSTATSIEDMAFNGCTYLVNVIIPNIVTSIGQHAFADCTSLASIVIPNSVTSIALRAFNGCTSLASVTLPTNNSFTSIGALDDFSGVFEGCTSLTSITIPNSVTTIGKVAFASCSKLASVTFETTSKVTSIGEDAFSFCSSLTSIIIPSSVTSIGNNAFQDNKSLASVTFEGTIAESNFAAPNFNGDLRTKYLAGGPGTYTTTQPNVSNNTWIKQ